MSGAAVTDELPAVGGPARKATSAARPRPLINLGREERVARGKAERARVPLAGLATFAPAPDRPDPVALLEQQAATRVPDLVPIRYGRMLASPFAFYRGAALLMATDLGAGLRSPFEAQLCGDDGGRSSTDHERPTVARARRGPAAGRGRGGTDRGRTRRWGAPLHRREWIRSRGRSGRRRSGTVTPTCTWTTATGTG